MGQNPLPGAPRRHKAKAEAAKTQEEEERAAAPTCLSFVAIHPRSIYDGSLDAAAG